MPRIYPLGISTELLSWNHKMEKTFKDKGIVTVGLELRSGRTLGVNMCPRAIELRIQCLGLCLEHAGNGRFKVVKNARYRRTVAYIKEPREFKDTLNRDIERVNQRARELGLTVAVRTNVFHDTGLGVETARKHPGIQFYDYTKEPTRFNRFLNGKLPSNYDLTWSVSEKDTPRRIRGYLTRGGRVAIVYLDKMPKEYLGFPVIDGDTHDARWLDPGGVVIGLKAKGKARGDKGRSSLFVLQ